MQIPSGLRSINKWSTPQIQHFNYVFAHGDTLAMFAYNEETGCSDTSSEIISSRHRSLGCKWEITNRADVYPWILHIARIL